ncbi:hypothetical protein BJ138DRAFT_834200 [Hygrophoropsis aurantiaca]|uniref:Uncharacterized protein n=1 Tax=Hygrophoropsis aurantiaca TaxID=72124 RepID=A0ACB7ZVC4_9AGAM|nr:hypothetical protein BJ138DRAFT_834200 [Hygrophoropsis aurantiaca]
MDDEYCYWSFVESHPAHVALPQTVRREAMEALHWIACSRTHNTLRHHSARISVRCSETRIPAPPLNRKQPTHTRITAHILLRMSCLCKLYTRLTLRLGLVRWRQQYFRPHKPLPQDVPHVQPARKRVPIGRKIVDIFVGILCLDISLLFVGRPRFVHIIGVMAHHSGLLIPVGACACLVAAIILSTSVTLRGLDSIGHIAGLVVTLCSAASMVSSVAALYPIQD